MSNGERQRLQEEQLKEEIVELRGELGETVEALVHKADIPARAKERGAELTERAIDRGAELTELAIDRGAELQQQAVKRGSELGQQVMDRWKELKAQAFERGNELREQAFGVRERARETVSQAPLDKWAKLACAGLALVAVMIIVRRVRIR